MGQVVALNYFKHKPNKNFALTTTTKGTYPVHILESGGMRIEKESENVHSSYYHDNFFNVKDTHCAVRRSRKHDISNVVHPQKGVQGVCRFYNKDESEFLAETQARITPQGFEHSEYKD